MSENSKIEWTDDTYNPWRGCVKVSPACKNCYAEVSTPVRVARAAGRELWGGTLRDRLKDLNAPLRWNQKPWVCGLCGHTMTEEESKGYRSCPRGTHLAAHHRRRVFCLSLGDWLDEDVPIEWLADLLKMIHDTPNLEWQLLTKRPENWRTRLKLAIENAWSRFAPELLCEKNSSGTNWLLSIEQWIYNVPPANVWIGTTVENQDQDHRVAEILKIPAKVRFLSVEPMLSEIQIPLHLNAKFGRLNERFEEVEKPDKKIHWVICGGESGPKKRPMNLEWARSLRDQCKAAGVPFFFKQLDKVQAIPSDLLIRQFPNIP